MTRIVYVISAVAVALFLNSPAWAGNSEEEQQIIKTVEETWKKLANKEVSDGLVGPTGTINAQSSGGLWMNLERKTFEANMKKSPDTLKFSPYHINVKFLGQKKDVAYVTYYLAGNIIREGKDDITNYRTRASNVMEKKDGKWVNSGGHYSPLFGGSGID